MPTAMNDSICPISAFIASLKIYDDECLDFLVRTIVSFNSKTFTAKCNHLSPAYDSSLVDFDIISREMFKKNERWLTRELVHSVMSVLAATHGWSVRKQRLCLQCNRFGMPDEQPTRNFMSGNLRSGCTFRLTIGATVNTRYIVENSTAIRLKPTYRADWDAPIILSEVNCEHGGSCVPGRGNRVAVAKRAGLYIKSMPYMAVFSLCNYMEHGVKLTSSLIKSVLQPLWTKHKEITKHDTFNLRVKIRRLMPIYSNTNGDYEEFKKIVNANNMLNGIENDVTIDDDEAYELAQSLWLEVTSTVSNKEEAIFSFINYLELIKSRAKGFVFCLAKDKNGRKKTLLGVLWQTATMRRNFELFGNYLCFDMMKRGINTLLWPYTAVAMYDEMMHVCLACEGIVCGERMDMYQFICDFLSQSTPLRRLCDVSIVSGDGFFNQEIVIELGFINARFVTDQWHMLDSGLLKKFGKIGHELLRGHLVQMIHAGSELEFDDILRSGFELIRAQPQMNGQMESDLEAFAGLKDTYASYCLAKIPGNRGLHGNAASESNHSSVLVTLNDGNKFGNTFCEHPIVLIRELLKRQRKHVSITNERLFGMDQHLKVEMAKLRIAPQTGAALNLIKAAAVLNKISYERYKMFQIRGMRDLSLETIYDSASESTVPCVRSRQFSDAPPRLFPTPSSRCNCVERIAEQDMCAHEIIFNKGFCANLFQPMHMSRKCVTGSLAGWTETASSSEIIDNIIGYDDEHLAPSSIIFNSSLGIEEDSGVLEGNPDDNLFTNRPGTVPVGYIPQSGAKVKPFSVKQMNNIWEGVTSGYKGYSVKRQWEISELVLKLQELGTGDGSQSDVMTNNLGESLVAPNNHGLRCQSQNRLQPGREMVATKAKRKAASNLQFDVFNNSSVENKKDMMTALAAAKQIEYNAKVQAAESKRTKKVSSALQNRGQSQVVVGKNMDIVVNGRVSAIMHCTFCNEDHRVTSCPKRLEIKMIASEYILTTDSPQIAIDITNRALHSMPLSDGGGKGVVYGNIDRTFLNTNFVIEEACLSSGRVLGQLESMNFCVSFLTKWGVHDEKMTNIWVQGTVMKDLFAHKLRKKKLVFDKTIIPKVGWRQR